MAVTREPLSDPARPPADQARARRRVGMVVGSAVALAGLGLGLLTLAGHGPLAGDRASVSASCPTHRPPGRPTPAPSGSRSPTISLDVPAQPLSADVCAYAGLNATEPMTLTWAARLSRARATALLAVVNTPGRVLADGEATHCPIDDGSAALIRFRYSGGATTDVDLALTGCRPATTGTRAIIFATDVVAAVERLRPGPGPAPYGR